MSQPENFADKALFGNLTAHKPVALIKLEKEELVALERPNKYGHFSQSSLLDHKELLKELKRFWEEFVYQRKDRILIGFIGYDAVPFFYSSSKKKLLLNENRLLNFPSLYFCVFENYCFNDRFRHCERLKEESKKLSKKKFKKISYLVEDSEYQKKIESALEYIRSGETYQINLSRPILAEFDSRVDPFRVYEFILEKNPDCQYSAYLPILGDSRDYTRSIVSASPECFLRKEGSKVSTFPIKGTRARITSSIKKDLQAQRELKLDRKEAAEHLMVVDIERNDLGRLAIPGTVKVENFKYLQTLTYAHHLVSEISAQVAPEKDIFDILQETFPSGSITGAPKLRTIELINKLENFSRQAYTGVLGYIDSKGDALFSILIRTLLLEQKKVLLNVGGGIVYDSCPLFEVEETRLKSKFFL